jgi:hypothetical protein
MAKFGSIWFLVCLIGGLYFLNLGFNFIAIPDPLKTSLGTWTNIIGGILIIVGGVMSLRRNPYKFRGRY